MYRLKRVSGKESKLFGVVAGISKYLDPEADPAIARILWVLLTIFNPVFMVLFYVVLAAALKRESVQAAN